MIMLKRTALLLLPLALTLITGCATETGGKSDAATGTNRPADTSPAAEAATDAPEPSPPAPEPSPPAEDGPLKFGETFKYENGVSITVAAPTPFKPSNTAFVDKAATSYVKFAITIVNSGTDNYDPALFSATLQSANVEGAQVFDSEGGLGGSPSTTILPGREAKFNIGFGVTDAKDLVMEASPGFEFNAAIFTT